MILWFQPQRDARESIIVCKFLHLTLHSSMRNLTLRYTSLDVDYYPMVTTHGEMVFSPQRISLRYSCLPVKFKNLQ